MIFLWNSYGEYTKVQKPSVLTMSYEGSDEEEEHKTFPVVINNNNNNVVTYSDSDSNEEDFKNNKDNFLMKTSRIKLKFPPKPLSTQKWFEP